MTEAGVALRERGEKGRKPEWTGRWLLLEGFRAAAGKVPVKAGEPPEVKRGRKAYRVAWARGQIGRREDEGKR